MKKLKILIIVLFISLPIFALTNIQTHAALTPSISLNPTRGQVGTVVTLSGTQFDSASPITATFGGSPVTLSGPATTDAIGSIQSGVTFTVPSSVLGDQSVMVTDGGSNSASATFTVTATLVAPTISASLGLSDQGQTSALTSTAVTTGISPYTYQWLQKAPGGSYVDVGANSSSYSFVTSVFTTVGSWNFELQVTDSASVMVTSNVASVTVAASPTVSIAPVGPITMDVGQIKVFTATGSGGSGSLSYQWNIDGGVVGTNSSSYSYTAVAGSHSVTCMITDSASTPVTSGPSNAVVVTVNSALAAPNVTPAPASINQGQTSSLTSLSVTTGTSPYTYQWLQKAPGGSYVDVGTNSSSFSFDTDGSTVTGVWSFELQVTDSASTEVTVTSTVVSVTVDAAPATYFVVSGFPSSTTAGVANLVTVTAKNAYGNTVTGYTGTVKITSSDAQAVLPANYAFLSGDNGVHQFSVTLKTTTTTNSITATDTVTSSITGSQTPITVNAAALDHFDFSTINSPQTAGTPITGITITAKDSYENTVTSYASSTSLTETDGGAGGSITQSPVTFASGVWSGSLTLTKSGSGITVTASGGGQTGKSNSFTVNAGTASKFSFATIGTQTAGASFSVTITAQDANGNTATTYTGNPSLTCSAGAGTINPTSSGNFAAGTKTLSVTITTSGSLTITVTDASTTGTSNTFTINPATLDHFVFSAIGPQTVGASFSITITAKDSSGNTVPSFTSTTLLSVSTGTISPTITGAFSNGVWTAFVQVTGAGPAIFINATDGTHNSICNTFAVASGAATHLAVSCGTSQVAGTPFTITVTAQDVYGNTATSYTGTVHFSTSDSGASVILPSDYTFLPGDLGSHTFTDGVTLMTAVPQSVTATDTATSSITGSQTGITVNLSSGIHFVITGFPNPATAGTAGTITVTVKDQYGNIFTGYTGTIKITSSDNQAVLPSNYQFQTSDNGAHSFSVTLKTAGSQTITATDTATNSITGSQNSITVNHAAASKIVISPTSSTVTAGASQIYTAMASDTFGNSWDVTSSTDWSISSSASGSWSNNVYTSSKAGVWTITGTYASITNTAGLTVNPGSLDHFVFDTVEDQTAGSAFTITVTAADANGNTVTSYTGSPSLTYSEGSINPTTMRAFTSGVGSTSVTVSAEGSDVTIKATDGNHSGTSNSFTVELSPTPTPTPTPTPSETPSPTPTETPAPTETPTPTPTPTTSPTPSPTPTPSTTTITGTTDSGSTVNLSINGNITSSQISNVTITSNQTSTTTIISFAITGPNGTIGFGNMTIPITAIPYGTTPIVYIDGQQALDQGFTQDANNFYVWYTTNFSTHQVTIQFANAPPSPTLFILEIIVTNIAIFILIFAVIVIRRKMKS